MTEKLEIVTTSGFYISTYFLCQETRLSKHAMKSNCCDMLYGRPCQFQFSGVQKRPLLWSTRAGGLAAIAAQPGLRVGGGSGGGRAVGRWGSEGGCHHGKDSPSPTPRGSADMIYIYIYIFAYMIYVFIHIYDHDFLSLIHSRSRSLSLYLCLLSMYSTLSISLLSSPFCKAQTWGNIGFRLHFGHCKKPLAPCLSPNPEGH